MSARDRFLKAMGVDLETSIDFSAPRVVHRMQYTNMLGQAIDFSVEHSNRHALERDLAELTPTLRPANPETRKLDLASVRWSEGRAIAHYSLVEWLELATLVSPGVWYYLGNPEAYAEARQAYVGLDPLKRILGKGDSEPLKTKRR